MPPRSQTIDFIVRPPRPEGSLWSALSDVYREAERRASWGDKDEPFHFLSDPENDPARNRLLVKEDKSRLQENLRLCMQAIYRQQFSSDKDAENAVRKFDDQTQHASKRELSEAMAVSPAQLPSGGGMRNLGATCYINSGMQMIRRFPRMLEHLSVLSEDPERSLPLTTQKLFALQQQNELAIRCEMRHFHQTCIKAGWYGDSPSQEEDSMEFVRWFMNESGIKMGPLRMERERSYSDGETSITEWQSLEKECAAPDEKAAITAWKTTSKTRKAEPRISLLEKLLRSSSSPLSASTAIPTQRSVVRLTSKKAYA